MKHEDIAEMNAAERRARKRRERIATAVLSGLVASRGEYRDSVGHTQYYERGNFASVALWHADELIKEMDKE